MNAGLALFEPLVARFRDTGFTDVTATVYPPDGRHEVLNETNRIEVIGELVAWLRARIGQPG